MMTITIDEKSVETRLDGIKKLADKGGNYNQYPAVYNNMKDTLGFIGLLVQEKGGKHKITIRT